MTFNLLLRLVLNLANGVPVRHGLLADLRVKVPPAVLAVPVRGVRPELVVAPLSVPLCVPGVVAGGAGLQCRAIQQVALEVRGELLAALLARHGGELRICLLRRLLCVVDVGAIPMHIHRRRPAVATACVDGRGVVEVAADALMGHEGVAACARASGRRRAPRPALRGRGSAAQAAGAQAGGARAEAEGAATEALGAAAEVARPAQRAEVGGGGAAVQAPRRRLLGLFLREQRLLVRGALLLGQHLRELPPRLEAVERRAPRGRREALVH
mmetsp:Transcript_82412/g.228652  ORF Transcript_82412/g.228652 Transcript_82412/m.228652 type:complete len:270 (+) Transcript_82412:334-1143(+)